MFAIAAGDRRAFGMLMARHLSRIVAIAHGILRNTSDAEDVGQETFLRVWRQADRWSPRAGGAPAWMRRIAVNLCLDRLRRPTGAPLDSIAEPIDPKPAADAVLLDRERNAAMEKAITALPERQRVALVLCYHQGVSNAEAADLLDVSVSALEGLLVRARRALRASLADFVDEDAAS